jgi:hypothetical protein
LTGKQQRLFEDKTQQQQEILTKNDKKINLNTIRNIFISDGSVSAIKKSLSGDVKDITLKEASSVVLDLASVIPLVRGARLIKGAKNIKDVKKLKKVEDINKKIPIKQKINNSLEFTRSIASDVGFAQRMFETAQDFYGVDNNLLDKTAKDLDLKNSQELYQTYYNEIAQQMKDDKIRLENFASFVGVDSASKKTILKGQNSFRKTLKETGLSETRIDEIISNLEAKRVSRVIGQILGAVKIEVSSEKLADKLMKQGISKKKAISTATTREFISVLASEGYVQEQNILPSDFFGALLLGATFIGGQFASQYFSTQKYKKLKKKDIDKGLEKLGTAINNKLNDSKKLKYTQRLLNTQGLKLKLDDIKTQFSVKEIEDMSKNYIKNSLYKNRNQKVFKKSEKLMLRYPIANILDLAEYPGDVIYGLQTKII